MGDRTLRIVPHFDPRDFHQSLGIDDADYRITAVENICVPAIDAEGRINRKLASWDPFDDRERDRIEDGNVAASSLLHPDLSVWCDSKHPRIGARREVRSLQRLERLGVDGNDGGALPGRLIT